MGQVALCLLVDAAPRLCALQKGFQRTRPRQVHVQALRAEVALHRFEGPDALRRRLRLIQRPLARTGRKSRTAVTVVSNSGCYSMAKLSSQNVVISMIEVESATGLTVLMLATGIVM